MTNKTISISVPSDDPRILRAAADLLDTCADWLDEDTRKNIAGRVDACETPVEEAPGAQTVEPKIEHNGTPSAVKLADPIPEGTGEAAVSITPVSTESPTPATATPDTDVAPARTCTGMIPWDERIHSRGKTKTAKGCWKTRQRCSDETLRAVEAELAAAAPVAPAAAPVAPAAAPVAPAAAPVAPAAAPVAPAAAPSFTFQDLMTTTNKLGYNDFQKIQELNSVLKAWAAQAGCGNYETVAEIASLPDVMSAFSDHLKLINGAQ